MRKSLYNDKLTGQVAWFQPQGVRVHCTQEQTVMADALEIPVALCHTGNALKLQEHYTR